MGRFFLDILDWLSLVYLSPLGMCLLDTASIDMGILVALPETLTLDIIW